MRLIKTFKSKNVPIPAFKANVYHHAGWNQYYVQFYMYNVLQPKMIYPADDLQDACERADYFVNGILEE